MGIGTTNPQAKLHVNLRIKAFDPVDDNDVATKGRVLGLEGGPRKNDDTITVSCSSRYKLIIGDVLLKLIVIMVVAILK